MAQFRAKEVRIKLPVRVTAIINGARLTDEEAERLVAALQRKDDAAIRVELIRAGTRIERGEHILKQLGWMQ